MAASRKTLPYVILTGLLSATMDLCGACLNYMIAHGKFPYGILKYIASGVFGKSAMEGGIGSNLWGLFFHYLIAMSLTAFYFFIYPRIKFLQKNVLLSAVIYGLFAWVVTNMIIVPLSAIHGPVIPADWLAAAKAALILVICIGLPDAYFAKKFYTGRGNI